MRRRTPSTRRSSGEASAGGRQRRKKEAQRIIRELHDDEYVGGGVPELHTLKSLTPSGLRLLAEKCGEQGLDRTHTAIAISLFWWIRWKYRYVRWKYRAAHCCQQNAKPPPERENE